MTPPGARLSDAAVAPAGQMSTADTIPTSSPVGFVPVNRAAIVNGTQVLVDNAFCVSGQPTDGNCVAFQLPKVRMVRVPRAASIGQQGNSAKSGVAAPGRPRSIRGLQSQRKHRGRRIAETNAALSLDAKRGGAIGQRADMYQGIGANTAARASPASFW